ncbi:MAG: TlpA disulfide reductase family protein [Myxococcota bacterium]|nr:TlpA disulfide reductase family protein [Myxococcota bacterium]
MIALFLLACAPRLYSDGDKVWSPPENSWPTASGLPEGFAAEGFAVGEVVPELVGADQFGDEVSLWQFYGDVVILDISTMWCAPCQDLAGDVTETQAHYEADGVVYLTVLAQDRDGEAPSVDDLAEWADAFEIAAPIVGDDSDWYLDAVPTNTFPQLMVLDRELKVSARDLAASDAAIREQVDALLQAEL